EVRRPPPPGPPVLVAPVSVFFGGPGSGNVATLRGEINCSSDCTGVVPIGRTVTLTATPTVDSLFAGGGGPVCTGTQPRCAVTLARSTQVIAYFRSRFKTVAAGAYHTCVLRPAGDIVCWGKNSDGQLGSNTTNNSQPPGSVTLMSYPAGPVSV